MELYTIKIDVNNETLTFTERPKLFSGDQNIDFVEFTFKDTKWEAMTDIWAVFQRAGNSAYQIPLDGNKAKVPAEVMQTKGYVQIGLFGTDGTNIQTSNVLQYSLGQGVVNVDSLTPSQSIYEQFLSDLDAYQTAVRDLASIQRQVNELDGDVDDLQDQADGIEEMLDNSQATFEGYVNEAKGFADESEYYAGLAEQASAKSGYLYFEIDVRGHLMMTRTENTQVTFYLDNGHLYLQGV